MTATLRLSSDVGGTFTDVAVFDEASGAMRLGKTLTTPAGIIDGIGDGVAKAKARFADVHLVLHGTTLTCSVADRIYILSSGRIQHHDTAANILADKDVLDHLI